MVVAVEVREAGAFEEISVALETLLQSGPIGWLVVLPSIGNHGRDDGKCLLNGLAVGQIRLAGELLFYSAELIA